MNNCQIIYIGLNIAAKDLNINVPNYDFVSGCFFSTPHITAMYLPSEDTILFNEDWIKSADTNEVLATSFHEVRHVYQKKQIDLYFSNRKVSECAETIFRWKKEFDYYHQPNSSENEKKYVYQEIEKDSIFYASKLITNIFKY